MREIKVRAWNKKTKAWLYWELGKDCMCDLQIYNFLTHYGQFTGLKDKNGKEIYEGDVVNLLGFDNRWYEAQVEWNDECAAFVFTFPLNRGYELADERTPEEREVIGNIYENPGLVMGIGGGDERNY